MRNDALPVSAWPAQLELEFVRRDSATILSSRRHQGPLRVQKALYPEGRGICHTVILHPPAGIAGGDELDLRVTVGEEAHALLTTPGAGKWYRSSGPAARQRLDFRVKKNATLEWLPQGNIAFDGVNGSLSTQITLCAGARFISFDVLCLGRRAAQERFENGYLSMDTRLSKENKLLWVEQAALPGGSAILASKAGLAGFSVCGVLLATGPVWEAPLLAECRTIPAQERGALVGVTAMPDLLVGRYLGHSWEAAQNWMTGLWGILRPAVTGSASMRPRLWST